MRFAKNTQQDTSKVLRLPRKMTMGTSKVLRLPRKLQHIFWQRHKSIAPATQNDFRHVPEHVWMSRSATPATRNEATTRLQPPKRTTSAELPIGTAIRGSHEHLRTAANGCERLRSWTQRRANTPSTPRPPEWNGNPCYALGKNPRDAEILACFTAMWQYATNSPHGNADFQRKRVLFGMLWNALEQICFKQLRICHVWGGTQASNASHFWFTLLLFRVPCFFFRPSLDDL